MMLVTERERREREKMRLWTIVVNITDIGIELSNPPVSHQTKDREGKGEFCSTEC